MEAKTHKTLGRVSLIGAGPGAADLITVRGARLLGEAEVVLHDALVSPEVFQYCSQAVLIAVGKRCGKRSTAQRFINRQLVDLATKYQRVVRLKGGDPMLFGRADEELQALEQAGIEYEVVPGITAALAAASAIRQPLTKRGVARSVAFVTQAKATDPDTPQPEGATPGPAAQADSLVYYMGRDQAASIAADLIARGRAPSTPAWVVEAATTPEQRAACFTLQQMADGAAATWINPEHPSLLMIGDAFAARASAAPEVLLGDGHRVLAA